MSDQEEDMCSEGMRPAQHPAASHGGFAGLLHPQRSRVLSRQLEDPDGSFANGVWGLSPPSQGAGVTKDVFAMCLYLEWMLVGGLLIVTWWWPVYFFRLNGQLNLKLFVLCVCQSGVPPWRPTNPSPRCLLKDGFLLGALFILFSHLETVFVMFLLNQQQLVTLVISN